MSNITKALAWAGAILVAAFVMRSQGVSDPASAGVVLGLSVAALGTLRSRKPCSLGRAR